MSTRMNYPRFPGNAGKFLRVNSTETDVEYSSAVPGTGVQSVTDDGNGFVFVDNTDPVNPVVGFDYIALALDPLFGHTLTTNLTFITDLANNTTFINILTSNATFINKIITNFSGLISVATDGVTIDGDGTALDPITLLKVFTDGTTIIGDGTALSPLIVIGGGTGGNFQVDQTPDNGTYAPITGAVDGVNTQYTVSLGVYVTGKLQVYLNGLIQLQGAVDDWQEVSPALGTFEFNTAPLTGDIITVVYNATGGSGSAGDVVQKTITQVAHGFSQDDVVRSSGVNGEYTLSQADVPTNADVVGIITSIVDADHFIISTEGFITMNALPGGAVAGDDLWLSDLVAGTLTLTEPTTGTTVSKPLAQVIDASTKLVYWHNYRGQENQTVPAGTTVYTNGSTTKNAADASGVQNIAHGLPAIPKKVTLTCTCTDVGTAGAGKSFLARAVYNGTTQSSQSTHIDSTGGLSDNTFTLGITGSTGVPGGQTGVITFDATNIIITWTKTGSPIGTYILVWEAETQ